MRHILSPLIATFTTGRHFLGPQKNKRSSQLQKRYQKTSSELLFPSEKGKLNTPFMTPILPKAE